jgi:pyridoxine 4-dehydrogenase
MGYGAMQLAGPDVFGPLKDRHAALAVPREAVARGVNHIQLIREALHPYPDERHRLPRRFQIFSRKPRA